MRAIFFRCGGDLYIPFVPFPSSQKNKFFLFFPELVCLLCANEKSAVM